MRKTSTVITAGRTKARYKPASWRLLIRKMTANVALEWPQRQQRPAAALLIELVARVI